MNVNVDLLRIHRRECMPRSYPFNSCIVRTMGNNGDSILRKRQIYILESSSNLQSGMLVWQNSGHTSNYPCKLIRFYCDHINTSIVLACHSQLPMFSRPSNRTNFILQLCHVTAWAYLPPKDWNKYANWNACIIIIKEILYI